MCAVFSFCDIAGAKRILDRNIGSRRAGQVKKVS